MADDNTKPVKHDESRNPDGTFKEGMSGNPHGRPLKGQTITDAIKSMMGEKPEIKKALTQKILTMALEGDIAAIRLIWNYIDGMPKQTVEMNNPEENFKKYYEQLRDLQKPRKDVSHK